MTPSDIEAAGDTKPLASPEPRRQSDTTGTVLEITTTLTDEQNIRIRNKTDRTILTLLTWIYFLQVFDKAVLSTSALFGLQEDTNLTGNQYSLIGSIAAIAQLAWQPFSAWLIVKVPPRILMPTMVLGWGVAEACIAACHNFGTLITARFFLGLFEAGCLPLFTYLTGIWYRRSEQPLRIAIWNGMNGVATMAAAAISYGLGHIQSELLRPWQTIFLFAGLLTIISAPLVYWKLDNDITVARFLTEEERVLGVERLRVNQTGQINHEFKWSHVIEMVLEPKSWLWVAMVILPNMGSGMTSVFGTLIIKGFGFDSFQTSLLNIPFGAMQCIVIVVSCWAATKARLKSAVLIAFTVPAIVGTAMLYGLNRNASDRPALLVAYYLCACLFAANPLILAWAIGNTAGATKKSTMLSLIQAGVSAGALAGPLLFTSDQTPRYLPGIRAVLGIFIALIGAAVIQVLNLMFLNKLHKKRRVANGKSAEIVDQSMQTSVNATSKDKGQEQTLEDVATRDLTDRENDEFIYIY
ncbi:major facilitator superfamily domain-containing protein [Aspergillus bertholletiae]|uniref:Major facilitator superfamily domain-containing protein n=1 Tax=Aspergillus bertholletiae TaxID=1226010 RepID=A0A5N7AXW1_9EURO|nr:major facilitator superfamily domain-containing protein [Aspergillus bertholletiae]